MLFSTCVCARMPQQTMAEVAEVRALLFLDCPEVRLNTLLYTPLEIHTHTDTHTQTHTHSERAIRPSSLEYLLTLRCVCAHCVLGGSVRM